MPTDPVGRVREGGGWKVNHVGGIWGTGDIGDAMTTDPAGRGRGKVIHEGGNWVTRSIREAMTPNPVGTDNPHALNLGSCVPGLVFPMT